MFIAGFQPSSSLRIDRQTVPDGYTFGWNSGGTNLPRFDTLAYRISRKVAETWWWLLLIVYEHTRLRLKEEHTFWWLGWVFIRERDLELEQAAFPDGLLLAGDTAIPLLKVHHAVGAAHGLCEKAKGMVSSP